MLFIELITNFKSYQAFPSSTSLDLWSITLENASEKPCIVLWTKYHHYYIEADSKNTVLKLVLYSLLTVISNYNSNY